MTTTTFTPPSNTTTSINTQLLGLHSPNQHSAEQWLTHIRRAARALGSFLFRPESEATRQLRRHDEFRRDQQALIHSGIHLL